MRGILNWCSAGSFLFSHQWEREIERWEEGGGGGFLPDQPFSSGSFLFRHHQDEKERKRERERERGGVGGGGVLPAQPFSSSKKLTAVVLWQMSNAWLNDFYRLFRMIRLSTWGGHRHISHFRSPLAPLRLTPRKRFALSLRARKKKKRKRKKSVASISIMGFPDKSPKMHRRKLLLIGSHMTLKTTSLLTASRTHILKTGEKETGVASTLTSNKVKSDTSLLSFLSVKGRAIFPGHWPPLHLIGSPKRNSSLRILLLPWVAKRLPRAMTQSLSMTA